MADTPDTGAPLAEVEARLGRLYTHLGVEGDPLPGASSRRLSPDVLALVAAGRTTDAARLHRDRTGCDLQTALAAVAGIPAA